MTPDAGPPDARRLYGDLAWLWPIISPPQDYIEESEHFAAAILEASSGTPKTLLHLGCGGGHNDFTLKRFFQVTGVDISQPMLDLAPRLNPEARYLEGDMRSLRLEEMFDAVVALDAINYMATEEDLAAVFRTAHAHLRPGGVFLTYAEETVDRFQQDRTTGESYTSGELDITFIEHLYDPDPADTWCETTFVYLIRRRGELAVEVDRHRFGLFPLDTWIRLLVETGFDVRHFDYPEPHRPPVPVLVCARMP